MADAKAQGSPFTSSQSLLLRQQVDAFRALRKKAGFEIPGQPGVFAPPPPPPANPAVVRAASLAAVLPAADADGQAVLAGRPLPPAAQERQTLDFSAAALPRWEMRRASGPAWQEAPVGSAGAQRLGFDPRRLAVEEAARQLARRSALRSAEVAAALSSRPADDASCTPLALAAAAAADGGLPPALQSHLRLLIEQRMLRLSGRQAALRASIVEQQRKIAVMDEPTYRGSVQRWDASRKAAALAVERGQNLEYDAQLKRLSGRMRHMEEENAARRAGATARNSSILLLHDTMRRDWARSGGDVLVRKRAHEAMKANDYGAYLEAIKADTGASEGRYDQLASFLAKTEKYLTSLSSKLAALKQTHEPADAAPAAGAGEEQPAGPAAYYTVAHSVGERITRQPALLAHGKLRAYQMVGLQWMISLYNNRLNGILADEMGLGKTVQVLALIAYLWENKGNRGPHLIVVPNSVVPNWSSEFSTWLPKDVKVVEYTGHREERERIFRDAVAPLTFNVLVTTYEFIMKDRAKLSRIKWRYLVIDEAQRMKDRESKLSRDLDHFECQNRLLLTGTPLQNDLSELWALLNLLLPGVFDSFAVFQSWFDTDGDADEWLKREKRTIVISRLHQILEPFMLRRRVEQVEGSLPPKVTHVLFAPMPAFQAAAYDWVKHTATLRLDPAFHTGAIAKEGGRSFTTIQNRSMELRKIVNHPCLAYPERKGGDIRGEQLVRTCGKLWLLDRMLVKLHATGHRVLLFSTMTSLLDSLEEYLAWRRTTGVHMPFARIDGSTNLEERRTLIESFNKPDGAFLFLLSIRAAGRGLNLQTADTVVIYDPDPNPTSEEQAVARSHRIGQKREVRVFHFEAVADAPPHAPAAGDAPADGDHTGGYDRRLGRATVGSVESLVRNTIQAQKIEMADEVINAGRFDQTTTHEERRATLEELLRDSGGREGNGQHVVPRLCEVNAMLARTPEELVRFEAMDRDPSLSWPSWQLDASELPAWLRYSSDEVAAAADLMAKKRGGGSAAAVAAAAAAELGDTSHLGRGVRNAANRSALKARNLAVRAYERGRLTLDRLAAGETVEEEEEEEMEVEEDPDVHASASEGEPEPDEGEAGPPEKRARTA